MCISAFGGVIIGMSLARVGYWLESSSFPCGKRAKILITALYTQSVVTEYLVAGLEVLIRDTLALNPGGARIMALVNSPPLAADRNWD